MHIAVCDDDIAQRKQTERLLGREADKWIAEGDQVYTYSYGSEESLLDNFMQFDAVFLDFTQTEGLSVKKVMEDLRNIGANSLMVVCSEGLESDPELPEDTLFLPKPIKKEALHEIMKKVKAAESSHTPLIELRGESKTLYVTEDEIIRAEQEGRFTKVYLTEGRVMPVHGYAYNLFDEICDKHEVFAMPGKNSIVNIRYAKEFKLGNLTMCDGKKYFVVGSVAAYIKRIMKTTP